VKSIANTVLVLTLSCAFLAACGGDDDDGPANAGPGPALTPAQCPAAPSDVSLDELAPVWGGLIVVNATVASGTPDAFDIEVFDPTIAAWSRVYGNAWQREDGRYAFSVTPSVTEYNKDATFKVRLRARLNGCPPSSWAEGPSYTLSDPLTGTTWVATWDAGAVSGEINVTRYDPMNEVSLETTYPRFDGSLVHTVTFAEDGAFDETYEFTLAGRDAGEPFDGCSFALRYTGTWSYYYERYGINVLVSERVPAENAADGSECAAPAPSALAINDETRSADLRLSGMVMGTGADYSALLHAPDGPIRMESYQLASALQNPRFLFGLSYETAEESGSVSGYLGPQYYVYQKQ
jgi:hypothetical protein